MIWLRFVNSVRVAMTKCVCFCILASRTAIARPSRQGVSQPTPLIIPQLQTVESGAAPILNEYVPLPDKIHIFGASGSGTTTLAAAVAARFGHRHIDVDDFFWEVTDPPFRSMRPVPIRQRMLADALDAHPRWALSGSLCGWGDIFIPRFELVIFLHIPGAVRMSRIMARERQRYGDAIREGGAMRVHHLEFIEWAAQYDTADEHMRSLRLHQKWMATLPCRCVRIEGDFSTGERLARLDGLSA
jgi:adenylate kinase family enzyme